MPENRLPLVYLNKDIQALVKKYASDKTALDSANPPTTYQSICLDFFNIAEEARVSLRKEISLHVTRALNSQIDAAVALHSQLTLSNTNDINGFIKALNALNTLCIQRWGYLFPSVNNTWKKFRTESKETIEQLGGLLDYAKTLTELKDDIQLVAQDGSAYKMQYDLKKEVADLKVRINGINNEVNSELQELVGITERVLQIESQFQKDLNKATQLLDTEQNRAEELTIQYELTVKEFSSASATAKNDFDGLNIALLELRNTSFKNYGDFVFEQQNTLNQHIKSSEVKLNSEMDSIRENYKDKFEEADRLLEEATGASLFHAFNENYKAIRKSLRKWEAMIYVVSISFIGFGVWLYYSTSTTNLVEIIALKVPMLLAFVGVDLFLIREYTRRVRLANKYQFKSTISVSLQNYFNLIKKTESSLDPKVNQELYNKSIDFLLTSIKSIYTDPTEERASLVNRKKSNKSHTLDELEELLKRLSSLKKNADEIIS